MKYALLIATLLSTQVFAVEFCSYVDTADFQDALEVDGLKSFKVSKNHKRFTFSEKKMIHLTVARQDWLKGIGLEEALKIFGDYYEGRLGSNAGEIKYFRMNNSVFALVHYWPGDNEYGAYFEVRRDSSFRLIGLIQDGSIYCEN